MKKIRYNIANKKKVDFKRLTFIISVILLISFYFIFTSVRNYEKINKKLYEQVEKKSYYENELKKIGKRTVEINGKVDQIRKVWKRKADFINSIIDHKSFSFLDRFDFFEKKLPAMVMINEISIDSKLKGELKISVTAYSAEKLYEFYTELLKSGLEILSESESDGVFKARLKIKIKNEKK